MHFELLPGLLPVDYGESVLSLDAAKAHLNLVEDHDDDLVAALRDAAVDMTERYTSLYLARRTDVTWQGEGFGSRMVLARGPAAVIASIAYENGAAEPLPLADSDWRIGPGGRILPAFGGCWPGDCRGLVTITFDAGFTDVAREAPALLAAVRFMLAHLYDNRDAVVVSATTAEIPLGFRAMCDAWRMPVL